MDYIVRLFMDNTYEVIDGLLEQGKTPTSYFQGSLADCESWIRLTESGRL